MANNPKGICAYPWQQFQIDDQNGDRVSETNTDPAPFIGLTATFKF